jgi:DNA-binding XRE family transcriptional regulator
MKKSRLQQLRERRELSRYRVAQDTGIPYATMMRLEDPTLERMSRKHLRLLVDYFGPELTLADLLS